MYIKIAGFCNCKPTEVIQIDWDGTSWALADMDCGSKNQLFDSPAHTGISTKHYHNEFIDLNHNEVVMNRHERIRKAIETGIGWEELRKRF